MKYYQIGHYEADINICFHIMNELISPFAVTLKLNLTLSVCKLKVNVLFYWLSEYLKKVLMP